MAISRFRDGVHETGNTRKYPNSASPIGFYTRRLPCQAVTSHPLCDTLYLMGQVGLTSAEKKSFAKFDSSAELYNHLQKLAQRNATKTALMECIGKYRNHSLQSHAVNLLSKRLPHFMYFSQYTYGSPIFKAVQQKWYKAWYRDLTRSPKSPEYALGEGSEPSHIDQSAGRL